MQDSDSSDSDSDTSMAMIKKKASHSKKQKLKEYLGPKKFYKDIEKTDEEKAYLKTVHDCDSTETSTLSESWHEPMGLSLSSKKQLNVYHTDWDLESYASIANLLQLKKKAKK